IQEVVDTGVLWARSCTSSNPAQILVASTVTSTHWCPLEIGWVKLNIDEVSLIRGSNASIGGVFRDSPASWLCGFSMRTETLLAGGTTSNRLQELRLIHQLLCRNWKVQIRHISRSPNKVVDHMAKIANDYSNNVKIFEDPPSSIPGLLFDEQ
ncbi:hypothetical protein Godav_013203, partial [Gossypium davidsonii]|nr:hypothetical protein [Gossypium davidsonii]